MPEIMEPTATPSGVGFPEVLKIIEGVVVVDTDDRGLAAVAYNGFVYRLSLEFARQQPGLALLYDIEIELIGIESGSIRHLFRAVFRLKQRVAAEVKKAGTVATLGVILRYLPALLKASICSSSFFRRSTRSSKPRCLPAASTSKSRRSGRRMTATGRYPTGLHAPGMTKVARGIVVGLGSVAAASTCDISGNLPPISGFRHHRASV
jgi:hypothetical protein